MYKKLGFGSIFMYEDLEWYLMQKYVLYCLIGMCIIIVLLLAKYLLWFLPTCDNYGGFMMEGDWTSQSCTCGGILYTIVDGAPYDGITRTVCIGPVINRSCSTAMDGEITTNPC